MIKDMMAVACDDCGDVSFVIDRDGWIELNACACVDGMDDLDWVNQQ